ncbi:hypothetical protein [Paraburkholderia sp. GAS41]|uniref:hypothetical protein n=1 Tax=Paraburkholderia sp. GAS41 TaxID=3035134 RepID=UPI003D21125A
MDHDVNRNQLRRWIARHQQGQILHAPGVPDPMVIDDVSIDISAATAPSPMYVSTAPAFVALVSAPPASLLPPTPASPGCR